MQFLSVLLQEKFGSFTLVTKRRDVKAEGQLLQPNFTQFTDD